MEIHIYTQAREAYGDTWKMKGGAEYVIPVSLNDAVRGSNHLDGIVVDWANQNLIYNEAYQEILVDWGLTDSHNGGTIPALSNDNP